MEELLLPLRGCQLPSYTGSVHYTVAEVVPAVQVTLTSPDRRHPSILPWADISRVFTQSPDGVPLTPTVVDAILNDPQNRDSSTMCALVLAMRDPTRVLRF